MILFMRQGALYARVQATGSLTHCLTKDKLRSPNGKLREICLEDNVEQRYPISN